MHIKKNADYHLMVGPPIKLQLAIYLRKLNIKHQNRVGTPRSPTNFSKPRTLSGALCLK